jgi:hypothetical protein
MTAKPWVIQQIESLQVAITQSQNQLKVLVLTGTIDLNVQIDTGFFRLPDVFTNGPAGAQPDGQLIVSRPTGSDTIFQILTGYNNSKYYMRQGSGIGTSPVWQPWVELYHTGNKPTAADLGLGSTSSQTFKDLTLTNSLTFGNIALVYNATTKSLDFNVIV